MIENYNISSGELEKPDPYHLIGLAQDDKNWYELIPLKEQEQFELQLREKGVEPVEVIRFILEHLQQAKKQVANFKSIFEKRTAIESYLKFHLPARWISLGLVTLLIPVVLSACNNEKSAKKIPVPTLSSTPTLTPTPTEIPPTPTATPETVRLEQGGDLLVYLESKYMINVDDTEKATIRSSLAQLAEKMSLVLHPAETEQIVFNTSYYRVNDIGNTFKTMLLVGVTSKGENDSYTSIPTAFILFPDKFHPVQPNGRALEPQSYGQSLDYLFLDEETQEYVQALYDSGFLTTLSMSDRTIWLAEGLYANFDGECQQILKIVPTSSRPFLNVMKETAGERSHRIVTKLKEKYPGTAVYDLDGRGEHFLSEIEPVTDHPDYDRAVEVIISSTPHKHLKMTQYYTVISGTLELHVSDKVVILQPGDKYIIQPSTIHWAKSDNECFVEIYSEPGWTKDDHIVVDNEL